MTSGHPTYKIYIKRLVVDVNSDEATKEGRMAGRGRPRRETPLSPSEIEERRIRYNANRNAARAKQRARDRAEKAEWEEIGWIVSKMSNQAKMSQQSIYSVLGGVFTKSKILEWSKKGRKNR